jgi:molybdenum ABC transporter molybdate-binding protein
LVPTLIGLAAEILVAAGGDSLRCSEGNQQRLSATIQTQGKFNFGPSSGLARQIDEGAPVDIFFSADLLQMDNLKKKGREPKTRKNLLSNQLLIIVPGESQARAFAVADPVELVAFL